VIAHCEYTLTHSSNQSAAQPHYQASVAGNVGNAFEIGI
jgi:hypothetical protein